MKRMKARTKIMRARRKIMTGWWLAVALSLVLVATSIGAAQATASARPSGTLRHAVVLPTLCNAVSDLDSLVVRRVDAFPRNHIRFSFPAVVSVSDPAAVKKAATALCALPAMPRGPMSCPADLGITYELTFSQAGRPFPLVVASATGCQGVTGLVPTRWAARTPNFWRELGEAMGLAHPTWETFRGSGGVLG
jgi:hypothetical protein